MHACQQQNVDAIALSGEGGAGRRGDHPLRIKHGGARSKRRALQDPARASAQAHCAPAVRNLSCDAACWKPAAEVSSSSRGPSAETGAVETSCLRLLWCQDGKATP